MSTEPDNRPLQNLDVVDEDTARRYPQDGNDGFRDYSEGSRDGVREFYRLNHMHQTVDFVRETRDRYLPPRNREMGIWEAMDFLNELVDDSDPDIELPQVAHAMQTADCRSNTRRRPSGLVYPDWTGPRHEKSALSVRRASVGRDGGHVSRGMSLVTEDCLSGVL